jgi:hypothetical protein
VARTAREPRCLDSVLLNGEPVRSEQSATQQKKGASLCLEGESFVAIRDFVLTQSVLQFLSPCRKHVGRGSDESHFAHRAGFKKEKPIQSWQKIDEERLLVSGARARSDE